VWLEWSCESVAQLHTAAALQSSLQLLEHREHTLLLQGCSQRGGASESAQGSAAVGQQLEAVREAAWRAGAALSGWVNRAVLPGQEEVPRQQLWQALQLPGGI
jgi:hypothetical protein